MRKYGIRIFGLLFMGLISYGTVCAAVAQTRSSSVAENGDALHLELTWTAPVDLDLFVTGPSGETIYFGNKQAKNGDKVTEESNCESVISKPTHLRETVLIPAAQSGKYRVSVDFILQCGSNLEEVAAKIDLFNAQNDTKLTQQTITVKRQVLNTVAMEFEVRNK